MTGLAVGLAGCGASEEGSAGDGEGVHVVASTTMLGDVAGEVVRCAGGSVNTLMPTGADPHDFQPSSADVSEMVTADLVVVNGLGLEQGLDDALASAEVDGARVLEVGPELDPIEFGAQSEGSEEHADHAGSLDPHVWLDAARMAAAAELIGAELGEVTGETEVFQACGSEVGDSLRETDSDVRAILDKVPAQNRVLVTDHASFGYFAQAYDFELAGVVVPGGSTLAEPSSQELAALVDVIETENIPAIFSDVAAPSTLVGAVASEAGAEVVELYVGSLGPESSGAQTYPGMVLTNAERIAAALSV